jgi:hypothetical protein
MEKSYQAIDEQELGQVTAEVTGESGKTSEVVVIPDRDPLGICWACVWRYRWMELSLVIIISILSTSPTVQRLFT